MVLSRWSSGCSMASTNVTLRSGGPTRCKKGVSDVRMHRKRLFLLLAALLLVLAVVGGKLWVDRRLTTVRLSEVVRSIFYAPQYVALSQGFFEDEGLHIELSTAGGADKGAAALVSGSVDIGFFGPEAAVYLYQQGAKDYAVGFAQLTAMDGSFLMARHPTANFRWEDLRGKTVVGARIGGVPQMVLEWILRQHGIDPAKDLTMITHLAFSAAPGAFQAGTGDYIAQFEPTLSAMEAEGIGKIVASLGVDGGPITYTVYHARKSYFTENRDILERFTRALYKGMQWVETHTIEEVVAEVMPYFPGTDKAILITALTRYRDQGTWNKTPVISQEGFEHLLEVMTAAGELKQPVPFEALMDNTVALKVIGE
jgi:NitT/TauT family transport system substrate-binding protein